MAEFKISLQKTLAHEGEYVNDPDDSGKETFRGISRINHSNWSGWIIIDKFKKDKCFPVNMVNNVTLENLVEQFYYNSFWLPLKADQISNQTTADSIFDFAVNSGIKTTVLIVQSVIGTKADGIIGENTLKKLNSLDFGFFQPTFTVAKISHYLVIIKKRPTNKKYLYGWIIRALEYHS